MRKWHGTSYIKTGWSHAYAKQPCQDAVRFEQYEHYILAAVSDGVGSLPNSQIASSAAVEAVDEWFRGKFRDLKRKKHDLGWFTTNLILFVRDALHAAAKRTGIALDTMDCNLAFAFIIPGDYALVGSLGDCAVCVLGKENKVFTAGSALANGTDTILSENSETRVRMSWQSLHDDSIQGFLVTTDGLEGELYYKNSDMIRKRAESYFNALLTDRANQQIANLISELPESFDDDISMVLLSCSTQKITLPEDPTWLCTCGTRNPITASRCTHCGADFVELYKDIVQGKNREAFFAALNRNPEEERRRIGLPPLQVVPAVKETAAPTPPPTNPPTNPTTNPTAGNSGINAEHIEKLIADMTSIKNHTTKKTAENQEKKVENTPSDGNVTIPDATSAEKQRPSTDRFWKILAIAAICVSLLLGAVTLLLAKRYRAVSLTNQYLSVRNEYYETLMEHEYVSHLFDGIALMEALGCDESELYTVHVSLAFVWDTPGSNGTQTNTLSQGDVVRVDFSQNQLDPVDQTIHWVKVTLPGGDTGWCRLDALQPWLSAGEP